jgi:hypothetical protein
MLAREMSFSVESFRAQKAMAHRAEEDYECLRWSSVDAERIPKLCHLD